MQDVVIMAMTTGLGYPDIQEYKYNLGYLQALRRVLEEIEQVQTEIRGD